MTGHPFCFSEKIFCFLYNTHHSIMSGLTEILHVSSTLHCLVHIATAYIHGSWIR